MKRVVFQRAHTHAGVAYARGEECTVTDIEAAWLLRHAIADVAALKPSARARGQESETQPPTEDDDQ